jgi:uncharacterized protein (TIGR02001 family)
MRKLLLAAAVAGAFASPVAVTSAQAQAASPHTLTGNINFVSDYRFRSISQTYRGPALQGGFDYSHSSGLYAGTWASNVSGNQYTNGNGLEWDFYGGWKKELFKDFTVDLGLLYYWYPNAKYNNSTGAANSPTGSFNNTELYIGATWKWFTLKYNHSTSDYFGLNEGTLFRSNIGANYAGNSTFCGVNPQGQSVGVNGGVGAAAAVGSCIPTGRGGSRGSGYIDLSANYDLGNGWGINGHVGQLRVKNYSEFNYTDYRLGVTKDVGNGFTVSLTGIANSAKTQFYRAADSGGLVSPTNTKNLRNGTVVFAISKTF